MSCPQGYILKADGSCEFVGYITGDANLDGTPDTSGNKSGKFWDWVSKNAPWILSTAGSVISNAQGQGGNQSGSNPQPPAQQQQSTSIPVWGWVVGGVLGLMVLALLFKALSKK